MVWQKTTHGIPAELDEPLAQLLGEIAQRLQAGEGVDLGEYAARHPQYAAVLTQFLPAMRTLAELGQAPADAPAPSGAAIAEVGGFLGQLGDYRIVREVGRGGMGIVYEAEQISLGRRVALKVLPFAAIMDPRQLTRFKNEAHAAASLQHENIVPVYSVGCEGGVHYYAMHYVEGQSLDRVVRYLRGEARAGRGKDDWRGTGDVPTATGSPSADSRWTAIAPGRATAGHADRSAEVDVDVSPAATLAGERSSNRPAYFRSVARLGIQAADALDYAHSHGVLHRDIKPGNLMLDTTGKLWVTDFGLARLENDSHVTLTGDVLGTLRYMSPEQFQGNRVVLDGRADIYALGATLYELLILEPVWTGTDRAALARKIAYDEPRSPRSRQREVPGELEMITLKALEKRPEDRYATARELADDLRRFLQDQPIHAKRPTLAVRVRKWARRHKAVVSTIVAVLLMTLVGLAASTVLLLRKQTELVEEQNRAATQQRRAEQAERMAIAQQRKAERAAVTANEINRFLTEDLLGQADPELNPIGEQITLLEILDQASTRVDTAFQHEPEVKAALHRTIGQAYRGLGQYEKSVLHYRAALDTGRQLAASPSQETVDLMIQLGWVLKELGQIDQSLTMLKESLAIGQSEFGPDHTLMLDALVTMGEVAELVQDAELAAEVTVLLDQHIEAAARTCGADHPTTLKALERRAWMLHQSGEVAEAEARYRSLVETWRRALTRDQRATLDIMGRFGLVLLSQQKLAEAEQVIRENLEAKRQSLGARHRATLHETNNLAAVLAHLDRFEEAEVLFRETVDARQLSVGPAHPETLDAVNNLSWLLMVTNRLVEAERLLRDNWESICRHRGSDHFQAIITGTYLGFFLLHRGEYRQAEEIGRASLTAARARMGEEHPARGDAVALLASALYQQGRAAEADVVVRADLGAVIATKRDESDDSLLIAWKMFDDGASDDAEQWACDGVEEKRHARPRKPPISLATSLDLYGRVLIRNGKAREAEPVLRECLEIRYAALPPGHWLTAETEIALGRCLTALERYADAEPLFIRSLDAILDSPELAPLRKVDAFEQLVHLYDSWGQRESKEARAGALYQYLQETLNQQRAVAPSDAVTIAELESRLGDCAAALERNSEAERRLLDSFHELATRITATQAGRYSRLTRIRNESIDRLVRFYRRIGDAERAEAWRMLEQLSTDSPALDAVRHCATLWEAIAARDPQEMISQLNYVESCLALARLLTDQASDKEELGRNAEQTVEWCAKAQESLDNVRSGNPSDRRAIELLRRCFLQRADALLVLARYALAFEDFERAVDIDPDDVAVLKQTAGAMANCPDPEARRSDRSLELAARAVELKPDDLAAWRVLGVAQYRSGQWAEGVESLHRLVTPDDAGGNTTDRLFLAMAYRQLGDATAARLWYERASARLTKEKPPARVRQQMQSEERIRLHTEARQLIGIEARESRQ